MLAMVITLYLYYLIKLSKYLAWKYKISKDIYMIHVLVKSCISSTESTFFRQGLT